MAIFGRRFPITPLINKNWVRVAAIAVTATSSARLNTLLRSPSVRTAVHSFTEVRQSLESVTLALRIRADRVIIPFEFDLAKVFSGGTDVNWWLFICDRSYLFVGAREVHKTASAASNEHVLRLMRITAASSDAPSGGTSLMDGTFNLMAAANVVQEAPLPTDVDDLVLEKGDKIGTNFSFISPNPTSLAGGLVVLELRPR